MNPFVRRAPSAAITLAAILGLTTLAGCNKPAEQNSADPLMGNAALGNSADALPALPEALPLESGPATAPKLAPSAAALPAARPAPIARVADPGQDYAYLDRAYGQTEAYGDAPPDYAFDYDGVSPWAWQAADDSLQFAEPIDGGYRYYYYEPGADYPYLIRDPSYSYGYSGGRLAVVYDDYGRVLDQRDAYRRADYAGRYLARARQLRQAAFSERRRRINAENWAARRAAIEQARQRWQDQRQREAGWRDYSRVHDQRQADYWRAERDRRNDEAQRFAGWQREGFRGPDPVRSDAEAQRRRAEAIRMQQQRQAAIADADRQRRADEANRQRDALNQQRDARNQMLAEQQRDRADAARRQAQADQQRQRDQALRDRQQAARQQQIDRAKAAADARANSQRQDRIDAQQQRQQAVREQQQRAADQRRQRAEQARRDQQQQQAEQRQRDARADAVRQRQDAARQQAADRARAVADQRRQEAARQQADRQREQSQARADAMRERQQAAARDRQDQARAQAQQRQQEARAQAQQRQQEARAQAQQRQQEARAQAQQRQQEARRGPPDQRRGNE
ncbi:hypothetical protein [Flavisphingomonas formosensis]|uniref:hypothetical protein n=1 Tax=Flavisphingomonas formosensis TaxID=861534 RepID=UPI0012FC5B55|nr:hypothetical protein [Sphingomonas formosensis]